MTKNIDRSKLFWEAMQTLQLLIEDGVIDIEKDMPLFYEALTSETERRLKGRLEEINQEYASLTNIWTEVYLGRFNWGHTELGVVLDILIKLILSGFLFVFGALLVFSPWFAFNWLLNKLPYKYRKPFDISRYR